LAVKVPLGTTLQQALALQAQEIAEWLNGEPVIATGVWAKVRPPQYVLREGDRIEIYRALKADPKQARRVRAGKKSVPA
jgi:putative ubiquitin-RnfH superfamily antitoxin RatB of RatAB toxin-antitoxin module